MSDDYLLNSDASGLPLKPFDALAMFKALAKYGKPVEPLVAQVRVHPQTYASILARWPKATAPVDQLAALSAIALIADTSVSLGWMHYHDGHGKLIRRVPPVGVQRQVSN